MSDSPPTPQKGTIALEFKQQADMADIAGSRSGPHQRPVGLWSQVLDGAGTEQDLVTVVREYLATLSPDELVRLPVGCRPGKISDGEDVSELAFRIASAHLSFTGPVPDRLLLERLMGFFTHAASRAASLQASASPS